MDPFYIFALGPDAPADAIEARYHLLVSQFPPDRAPEIFSMISTAYQVMKDEHQRLRRWLQPIDEGGGAQPRIDMLDQWFEHVGSTRATVDQWRQVLKQTPLPKTMPQDEES